MNEIMDALSQIGEKQISTEFPVGVNIRYDDEFEFIEDELSKLGSMIDRGGVNWDKVVQSCINVLLAKSKDLKVSCYLIRGLYEMYGLPGLKSGLEINYQLLNRFWDDLFPLKQRAKANCYEWLSAKFETIQANISVEQASLTDLQKSYESIHNIENFLNEKLNNKAPALGYFRRSIYDLLESRKEIESRLIADTEKNNQTFEKKPIQHLSEVKDKPDKIDNRSRFLTEDKNNSDLPMTLEPIQSLPLKDEIFIPENTESGISDKDKKKLIRQCQDALRSMTSIEINQSLDTPSAYAINRFTTWMGINQLPMHSNKLTPLKPIPVDKINIYHTLFNNKNYQKLIPMVEQSFTKSPFWLDAHRLIYFSLEALGFVDSAMQVKENLAVFLRRFPELCELKFSDQTPFADDLTQQWIHSEVLNEISNLENTVGKFNSEEGNNVEDYDAVLSEVHDLVSQNKVKNALQIFQKKIKAQENTRDKTFWKYHLAKFCYDISYYQLAFFLLQEIDGFLEKYKLKYWEPELEKNVVHLLYLCIKKLDESDKDNSYKIEESQRKSELLTLYSRLCQLDPLLAFDIQSV